MMKVEMKDDGEGTSKVDKKAGGALLNSKP
jgi:hypothetical protein